MDENEAGKVMEEISSGKATPAQISAILTALAFKGESVSEITGFARVMREKVKRVVTANRSILDTCGTGGDSSYTFNISTISAFVTAGAGVAVAKHGNRSVTSKCGSADVLEALGINIMTSIDNVAETLENLDIAFLFAPLFHESVKNAVPVRREIGIRTIFNIIGPLTNPALADMQIIGVYEKKLVNIIAEVLVNLGIRKAMVVHGSDGLDEITLTGITHIAEVNNGWIRNYTFDPNTYGFEYCTKEDLLGGDIKTNKEIALSVLNGDKGAKRDAVIINSAAAIYLHNENISFEKAIELAKNSIDSGKALSKLNDLINFTNR